MGEQRIFAVEIIGLRAGFELEVAIEGFAEADSEKHAVGRRMAPKLAGEMDAVRISEAFIAFLLIASPIFVDGVPHLL